MKKFLDSTWRILERASGRLVSGPQDAEGSAAVEQSAERLRGAGLELLQARRCSEAEVKFRESIAQLRKIPNPRLAEGLARSHLNLGETLGYQGRWVEAATQFRQAVVELATLSNIPQQHQDAAIERFHVAIERIEQGAASLFDQGSTNEAVTGFGLDHKTDHSLEQLGRESKYKK